MNSIEIGENLMNALIVVAICIPVSIAAWRNQ